jgi:hypothetical protein
MNFWGDRALYWNRVKLSRKQAIGALIYGLCGAIGGGYLVEESINIVQKNLGQPDFFFLLIALLLPFSCGLLVLIIGSRIAMNATRQLLRKQR